MCTCSCSKKKKLTDTQRLKIYKSSQYFNFLKYFEILTVVQTTNTLPTAVHLMRKLLLALTSSDYRQITGSDSVKKNWSSRKWTNTSAILCRVPGWWWGTFFFLFLLPFLILSLMDLYLGQKPEKTWLLNLGLCSTFAFGTWWTNELVSIRNSQNAWGLHLVFTISPALDAAVRLGQWACP